MLRNGLLLIRGRRLFGLEINLIEFEFRFGDGARRGVDTPAENIQQVDNRYGVETLVDDDRFGRVVWRFDLDDRFVEAAANFGRIGERDVGVFHSVDGQGGLFGNLTVESDFGF